MWDGGTPMTGTPHEVQARRLSAARSVRKDVSGYLFEGQCQFPNRCRVGALST
jgi:hypothetical protein